MNDNQHSTELGDAQNRDVDRFDDPGLPEHRHRRADSDPAADKRAERQVVILFLISIIGTVASIVAYFVFRPDGTTDGVRISTLSLGLGMAFALLGIGLAAVHWAKTLMNDTEVTEERHEQRTPDAEREIAVQKLSDGAADSGIARRGVLKGAALSALAIFPLTIAVPLVSSVGGDWNVSKFRHTRWDKGTRLAIDPTGRLIKAADVTIGSVFHVIPDATEEERESHAWITEKAKAVVLVVRLDPRDLKEAEDRKDWSHDGIVAYSKICTHVGCPVALYEQQTHHLLCPCHQSTFDIADGAKVVFGPAKRPLPQLPISVDDEGYLVAKSDFHEPVGPSYWERLK
ncbi:menaquinol-cytochrome c reductase iron-sulfur subunit precursor [Paraoerskovia marina]|uniref:Cytochrome bc1 complex Rieske iron-sulfur subunit n=1 Tax=Paraoerskovia marina TaxID=545619 RepID=A0A1H1S7T0_9CELL|nr:Rieske 2Fe-2S domain-containing protein [Paraoerskovia marina]SDS44027.1 menaquinol-cytochrome c reductase iron-sulfur subunit precursor [Paraoerskovia marina]